MQRRRMKPFHAIAIPHPDIVTERVAMETFATDLWEVSQGRGSDQYASRTEFFNNTYQSEGLKHVLSNADLRLQGKGGDPVLQLKAPFGAGKTHSLIALYHYVATMNAKQAVIVGTAVAANETLWGLLETQLTGSVKQFGGQTSPGREAIRELLATHQPVNILIDKVSEYVTKAAAIPVGESTLAAQTLLFFQELSEAVSALDNAMLAFTLPSGSLEQYDPQAKWFFEHVQKITGRVDRVHNLLQDHEVAPLIRQRLFAKVDTAEVQKSVGDFLEYARQEALLPAGTDPNIYRRQFEASFPFLPEVLDVLYHRWGTYPAFQRIRGMLRLLALVLRRCQQCPLPYITLADMHLDDSDVRYELLHNTESEVEKILVEDILADTAGAKMVDVSAVATDTHVRLGTRAATTIFFYSFPETSQRGASFSELKRHALLPGIPASALVNIVQPLKNRLLYLQHEHDRFHFSTRITLNRLLLKKLETIEEHALEELENELLHKEFSEEHFQVFLGDVQHDGIPDTATLKLMILKTRDEDRMWHMVQKHGDLSRINRNTLYFLVPIEEERERFLAGLRRFLALGMLLADSDDDVSDEHRKEVRNRWRNMESDMTLSLRRCYRLALIPGPKDFKERELVVSVSEGYSKLEQQLYARLTAEGDILERIAPFTICDVYLRDKPFVFTEQLARFNATTIGEPHVPHRNGWIAGISLGVREGTFGLGIIKQRNPVCLFFKQDVPDVNLSGNEVLIRQDLCEAQQNKNQAIEHEQEETMQEHQHQDAVQEKIGASERFEARLKERQHAQKATGKTASTQKHQPEISEPKKTSSHRPKPSRKVDAESHEKEPVAAPQPPVATVDEPPQAETLESVIIGEPEQTIPDSPLITSPSIPAPKGAKARSGNRQEIHLRFNVPQGNVTDLMSIIYSLRHKFNTITLEIHAEDGGMTAHEYQMNVQELLRNMSIFVEEAEIE